MANQTYRLVITGNAAGQFVQNIFNYRMDDDSFSNRLLAAKGLIDGFLAVSKQDDFLGMVPEEYLMKSIKCRRITNGGGPEYIDTSVDGSPGVFGSGMQMSGAGPVIIWNTDGGARRVGKTFLPGIGADEVNGGEIVATAIAGLLAAANTFRASFNAVGGSTPSCLLCIPRSNDPETRSLIVGAQVSKIVGQMRRRQLPA